MQKKLTNKTSNGLTDALAILMHAYLSSTVTVWFAMKFLAYIWRKGSTDWILKKEHFQCFQYHQLVWSVLNNIQVIHK
jgi:hypothetical protein